MRHRLDGLDRHLFFSTTRLPAISTNASSSYRGHFYNHFNNHFSHFGHSPTSDEADLSHYPFFLSSTTALNDCLDHEYI